MKITNYNIHKWIFALVNLVWLTSYFFISWDEFSVFSFVMLFIWVILLCCLVVLMLEGEIEFEFTILPSMQKWKEKRAFQRVKKEKISELKKLAIEKIDNLKEFEKIIDKIAKLEDEKFKL